MDGTGIFWAVLAFVYLLLAIVSWLSSKTIYSRLSLLSKEDALTSIDKKTGEEVGLESTVTKAIKAIFITNICGFILASAAAFTSIFVC